MDNTSTLTLKDKASAFLRLAAAGQIDDAYAQYVGEGFCHHNPYFASDAATLKAGMRDNAAQHPDKRFEIQRAIAEAPFVAVHSRIQLKSEGPVIAVVHLFRFDTHGRIAELWDIGQAVPDNMANERGMF